ncbi:MAG: 50S ribosomal protein L25 [Polyangiales bacterium]
MQAQQLQGEIRTSRGKGAARKCRAAGRLPAVLYGPGGDNQSITLCPHALSKALATEHGRNAVLEIAVGDKREQVLLRELTQHPVSAAYIHADFYRVDESRPVRVNVLFRAEGRPVGVQRGGKMRVVLRTLPVSCAPSRIPAVIAADVSELNLGAVLTVDKLPLPEGVTVDLPASQSLVVISGEDSKKEEEANEAAA